MTTIDTAPNVQNGTYTVSGHGQHFTLKLYTADFAEKGEEPDLNRVIALLVGPDNTSDFKGVAFWNDDRKTATVWKRNRADGSPGWYDGYTWRNWGSKIEKKVACWADMVVRGSFEYGEDVEEGATYTPAGSHWAGEGFEIQRSARCVKCNRELTDPTSIKLGIGPTCRGGGR